MPQNLPTEISDQDDLIDCVKAQINEMERFKWFLGEQLGHDPLNDRSLNEIYEEWIEKYGADYRKRWDEKKRQKHPECPVCVPPL